MGIPDPTVLEHCICTVYGVHVSIYSFGRMWNQGGKGNFNPTEYSSKHSSKFKPSSLIKTSNFLPYIPPLTKQQLTKYRVPLMTEALNRDYQLCEEIGRGRFGTVFRCTLPNSGDSFAVKSIDKSLISGDTLDAQCILTEPKILRFLTPHAHIVQIFNVYEDELHLHIVLELCDSQDLYHRLISKGILSETEAKSIITQVFQAISHMHLLGIVHRDLKPDNILFSSENIVKISDFGSADFLNEESGEMMKGVVGTPYYVAPEVLSGREYNEKVDVWSAGVILYIMLAGFPPFYGETVTEIFEAILRGNLRFPTHVFQSISPMAKDLLRRMLCKDVSRRFSADQVLRHPWITSGGVADLT